MNKQSRNENPLQKANIINKCFFWWLKDIFKQSQKRDLKSSDIYDTMPEDKSESLHYALQIAWQKEMANAKSKSTRPSLTKVIVKTYYWSFLKLASLAVFYIIGLMIQPHLLEMIMRYFHSTSTMATSEAYTYATLSVIIMAFYIAAQHHANFLLVRLGMQIKVACSSLIFNKITKLPATSRNEGASAITLLSIDVARFEQFIIQFPFMLFLPLQLAGVTYLIYSYVGLIAALSAITVMILQSIPFQMLYYKLALKWRAKQVINTDKRISLIGEIIAGVRVIKMYTWESYFEKLMYRARSLEVQGYLKISYLFSAVNSLKFISHRIGSLIVTLIYLSQCSMISMENVLPVRQHLYNLRSNMSMYFVLAVQAIANVRVSIERIENFLLLIEIEPSIDKIIEPDDSGTIFLKNVSATWDETMNGNCILNTVNIDFLPKKTYAILGATGSGKSSLLNLMLGELKPISGQVSIGGQISYASQEPWLFAASVRENILFGEIYEAEHYERVVKVCALLDDFHHLPYGDKTMVGDRGMSLSGGQRARISLARAVYRKADIYLLDDPFSAVDTRVAKILRSQCVDELLKDKTVILVTHNLHYLRKDDHVVLLSSGKIKFEGSVTDFQKIEKNTVLLPAKQSERIESTVYSGINLLNENLATLDSDKISASNANEEIQAKGSLSISVFLKYTRAGGYTTLLMAMAFHFVPIVLMFQFDFEMVAWIQGESQDLGHRISEHDKSDLHIHSMIILGGILALAVSTTILKNALMYRFIYVANQCLHNNMFARLIRTPMRFFEVNPAGRVLNRFSDDIGDLDNVFPDKLVDAFAIMFLDVGSLIFILLINWWNILLIAIAIFFFKKMSCLYVPAATKTKRLAAAEKSPVLNFVNSTLAGLTTIRSCQSQQFVMQEFAERLNRYTAAYILVLALPVALQIWMGLLAVGLFGCTAYTCIVWKNYGILAEQTGLILTTIFEFVNSLPYLVRFFADICILMINVERVVQYNELDPEDSAYKKSNNSLLESWPCNGEIRFEQVSLRYPDAGQPVLNDLSFIIEPGTKVGVVGRTGAGKSSLITALFRLAKLDGRLLIGNVDTQEVDLHRLRSKISIIPQEPVLFSTSLRNNLDPLSEFDDATLWSALDSVGLKPAFFSLDLLLEKGGKNLSLGQRQLLCLARAAAKNNKILVLDEATANVDYATDVLIQKTIRNKFKSCTVLTIAHRLNTIMDSDKILVMDHGRIVEYDHPHKLLQNPHGIFSKMFEQYVK